MNIYGFRLIRGNSAITGSYFHPKFQRGRKDLVGEIARIPIKSIVSGVPQIKSEKKKSSPKAKESPLLFANAPEQPIVCSAPAELPALPLVNSLPPPQVYSSEKHMPSMYIPAYVIPDPNHPGYCMVYPAPPRPATFYPPQCPLDKYPFPFSYPQAHVPMVSSSSAILPPFLQRDSSISTVQSVEFKSSHPHSTFDGFNEPEEYDMISSLHEMFTDDGRVYA